MVFKKHKVESVERMVLRKSIGGAPEPKKQKTGGESLPSIVVNVPSVALTRAKIVGYGEDEWCPSVVRCPNCRKAFVLIKSVLGAPDTRWLAVIGGAPHDHGQR